MPLLRSLLLGAALWGWAALLAVAVMTVAEGVLQTYASDLDSLPTVAVGRDPALVSLVWMAVAGAVGAFRGRRGR